MPGFSFSNVFLTQLNPRVSEGEPVTHADPGLYSCVTATLLPTSRMRLLTRRRRGAGHLVRTIVVAYPTPRASLCQIEVPGTCSRVRETRVQQGEARVAGVRPR